MALDTGMKGFISYIQTAIWLLTAEVDREYSGSEETDLLLWLAVEPARDDSLPHQFYADDQTGSVRKG